MDRVTMTFFLLHFYPQYKKQPEILAFLKDQEIQEAFEKALKELVHEEEFKEFLQERWNRKMAEREKELGLK